jgi:Zn-finger protein
MTNIRPCPCGSGEPSHWQHDADGIPLCRTCIVCHQQKLAKYRKDILTVSSRFYGERIEEDE